MSGLWKRNTRGCGILHILRRGNKATRFSEIAARVKTASRDALSAFKVFAVNPVGGLSVAFESINKNRALWVGAFFVFVYDVLALLGFYFSIRHFQGGLAPLSNIYPSFEETGAGSRIGDILKLLVAGAVPPASIFLASYLARKIFRGAGGFEGDVFIAGAAVLPVGLFIFGSS